MWSEPIVVVAAQNEPISLDDAKKHCRVTSNDHDDVLNIYIAAARDYIEKYTGVKINTQTVSFELTDYRKVMNLPVAPIKEITSVTVNGAAFDDYEVTGLNTLRPIICWNSKPNEKDRVLITAIVGFDVTQPSIYSAMLLLVGQWFDNREALGDSKMVELPFSVTCLLENYRIF